MVSRSIEMRQLALLLLLGVSACAAPPPPAPLPVPAPPPSPPAPVLSGNWRDWPITPGTWQYLPGAPISSARYGDGQTAHFIVRCDSATRRVTIMRSGSAAEFSITTSTRTARFPAGHIDESGGAMSGVILNATDAFLDELVFSRGRIAVQSPGLESLAIPAWAEPARAIEDCRK